MSWNAYDLKYKILEANQSDYMGSISQEGSSQIFVPNQLWKGYYDPEIFKEYSNTAWGINLNQYYDFGVSIRNYGCAVCSAVGAINMLNYRKPPA